MSLGVQAWCWRGERCWAQGLAQADRKNPWGRSAWDPIPDRAQNQDQLPQRTL